MAAGERRRWSCVCLQRAPVAGPCARRQLKGLAFILLVCGQEVSAGISSFLPQASEATLPRSPSRQSRFPVVQGYSDSIAARQQVLYPSFAGLGNGSHNEWNRTDPASSSAGFVTWESPRPGRRMTAVSVKFKLEVSKTQTSNLVDEGPSAVGITVHSGVVYSQLIITANSGLGFDSKKVKAKLVPYDFAATLQTCADVGASMGTPFDGSINQVSLGAEEGRNDFTNSGNGFSFPQAGEWRLCYSYNGVNWEQLAPKITVIGSERTADKFWCALSLLQREACPNTPELFPGCECAGKVEGYKIHNMSNALTTLGYPNPNYPAWTVSLTSMDKECGSEQSFVEPFLSKTSQVTDYEGFEIHNFGPRRAGTTYGVWKVCYCVGYDFDSINGACYREAPEDFPQTIGTLITVEIKTKQGTTDIIVYPTLRFSLVMECGTTGNTVGSPGGCTNTDVARYKIVEQKRENNLPYFNAGAGCRFLPQVSTTTVASKTMGGHLGPDNCLNPVLCNDKPEVMGPKLPTWNDVQLDASYENTVMMDKTYDVCYCDGSCLNSMFWFKAGSITVKPIRVYFSDDGNRGVPPVVNTMYYLKVQGDYGAGGWTTMGANTREMKVLRDNDGIVDKIACLSQEQPNVISGHRLIAGNTDYTDPSETIKNGASRPIGQKYGQVLQIANDPQSKAPNIKILEPGWYAVCYCDTNCNEMLNWSVYGRTLVGGPLPGQQWKRYVGVTFDLDIKGWNLGVYNRLRILSTSNELGDCGTVGQSDRVYGPEKTAILKDRTTNDVLVTNMKYDPRGTEIEFAKLHELKDGDRIKLEGVNAPTIKQNEMYNRVHEIFVSCDDAVLKCYKILIPIRFPAAEFPALSWDSVTWTRTSIEKFKDIRITVASPEGRGYIVCWSPEKPTIDAFVGQAGKIQVKDAIDMPEAAVGLTTIKPEAVGPVMIAFKTGDIARYAQAVGPMQLKIVFMSAQTTLGGPFVAGLEMMNYALQTASVNVDSDEFGEETQAVCGELFSEMWSEDPNGFPMPKGCYYSEDIVNSQQTMKQAHIVFSPRNHLKKNTKYMLVMNAKVKEHLKKDFPGDGAVFIWSMDDYLVDPFRVIELGKGLPQPEKRVPPRDSLGALELNKDPDGIFDPIDGFKILGQDHLTFGNSIIEMNSYCLAHDSRYPDTTPREDNGCKVCNKEEDCGNGNEATGQSPNLALNWCVSPLDTLCPAASGSTTAVPAFEFALKAKYGRPIKRSARVRIFLQPLTAWNIQACTVTMSKCVAPGGLGACSPPVCESESVVGGSVVGVASYPVNIIKVTLPNIMADITSTVKHTVAVGGLPLPPGGFLPQTISAELLKDGDIAPDYWDTNTVAQGGAKLYKQPKVLTAAIVTHLGDGNTMPFKNDKGNVLYIRMVVGANLWASVGDGISFQFRLPFGYKCDSDPAGIVVPKLGVTGDGVPSYQGRLGGNQAKETHWAKEVTPIVACTLHFREHMVYYAYSTVFVGVRVQNPIQAMKQTATNNNWFLVLSERANKITAPMFKLRAPKMTATTIMPGYGGSVPTLGKLSNMIIAPGNLGLGQTNAMDVFFKTEQEVGTVLDTQTEVWVDAPSGFDFGQYCGAYQLPDNYYIPEPVEKTFRLPAGALIGCSGVPTSSKELTYNRAKIKTTGRLLKMTTYAFRLIVVNANTYIRSQLNDWRIWTYLASIQAGVDGAYVTPRFNERVPAGPDTGFGCYQKAMPPGALGVSVADLRPTMGSMRPTDITFLPITVQLPMQKAVRILAPSGYQWDFSQTEFRYKAPGRGIPTDQAVPGAEQDLPITGVPAKPIAEPRNRLAIDYMQAEWIPGVKYGFIAKIRVPPLPPTTTGNFFSIEFGYDGLKQADRLEAGVVMAPLVRRIINGRVGFTTSIVARKAEIEFSMQLITKIPRAGGLVILGPPNFMFSKHCQPKPVAGFPEMPYDSTCLFRQIPATGQLEISIVAGPRGIPSQMYRFSLLGTNPPQAVSAQDAGQWVFNSYQVISEQSVLDYKTNVSGYSVNKPMYSAKLIAPPLPTVPCYFTSLQRRIDFPFEPITNCPFEDWQFYPDGGGSRDDRPNLPSALIFQMQLATNSFSGQDIVVRGPEGYTFNAECKVVVDSAAVFNDTNVGGIIPKGYIQKYAVWPAATIATNCYGNGNVARIAVDCGDDVCLTSPNKYIFRLQVLKNPAQTPVPNKFMIEYNGEASEPFEGVQIWAFTNTTIIPTTTASSIRSRHTLNNVTVYLRPTNDLPNGGHLRIEAPSGFQVKTICRASVQIHKDERPNITAIPAGAMRVDALKYAEFLQGDFSCEGDVTMSSRSRLHFKQKEKFIKKGILYEFVFEVTNPQTTTQFSDPWVFTSYKDSTPNHVIDTATVAGFPINDAAVAFAFMSPNSVNALARQLLEFNMSFPMDVLIGDMIQIVAPVTFYFSEEGDARCPDYQVLDGSMRRTVPLCGANTMTWLLQEEMVPALTSLRFLVRVKNPPSTPARNLFQLRQVAPTGKRKSSRMIPGYAIIPELSSVVVDQMEPRPPIGYCRPLVPVITGKYCTAAGSHGAVSIRFMPMKPASLVQLRGHVDGNIFDFSQATLSNTRTINARDQFQITANMEVRPDTQALLDVEGIKSPNTPGIAKFTVTTYKGSTPEAKNRIDEKLDLPSFEVLQYIERISSRVNPIYYGAQDATVSFELEPLMAILQHDVFRITRPPGYRLMDESFQAFRELRFSESGLDKDRIWSTSYENPQDYYVVISKDVTPKTRILWTITANLPPIHEAVMNWYFQTYRILPQRDVDGEILDAAPVRYPWVGRDGKRRGMQATGTNDGAFTGFILVGQVPFIVTPERQTPGAEIRLTISFKLPYTVQATQEVRMEVVAPAGFLFKDSCFSEGSPIFRKCTGYRATATLVSTVSSIPAGTIPLKLAITNPGITPVTNTWTLKVFQDDSTQYVNWSPGPGYEILPMVVVYRGNNQLAVTDTGFFDFTPLKGSLSETLYVVVVPPPGQHYRLLCTGVEPLGFTGTPICTSGPPNSNLRLKFQNGTLSANRRYTLGVGVLNPGGKPLGTMNNWGILLQDSLQKTFDGNLRVAGLELKTIPVRSGLPFMGWLTTEPRVMNTVTMQMRVLHRIPAAMITKFVIGAPYGVRFMEDTNSVKVTPIPLPLLEANPTEVANPSSVPNAAGPLLLLNLDVTKDVEEGMYIIRFECSNPGTVNFDNTWSIIVMKDIEIEYSHYNVGFFPGKVSPYEVVGGGGGGVGVASRAAQRQSSIVFAFAALAGLLGSARLLLN